MWYNMKIFCYDVLHVGVLPNFLLPQVVLLNSLIYKRLDNIVFNSRETKHRVIYFKSNAYVV